MNAKCPLPHWGRGHPPQSPPPQRLRCLDTLAYRVPNLKDAPPPMSIMSCTVQSSVGLRNLQQKDTYGDQVADCSRSLHPRWRNREAHSGPSESGNDEVTVNGRTQNSAVGCRRHWDAHVGQVRLTSTTWTGCVGGLIASAGRRAGCQWCVELALAGDEACSRVDDWLKWTQVGGGDAVQYDVTVVDTSSDEGVDIGLCGVDGQSAANSTQLSQLMKATPGTLLHVRRKCQSAIEHNIEAGDFIRYFNVNIGQSNRMDVELGQLLRRTQPVLTVFWWSPWNSVTAVG